MHARLQQRFPILHLLKGRQGRSMKKKMMHERVYEQDLLLPLAYIFMLIKFVICLARFGLAHYLCRKGVKSIYKIVDRK